MEQLSLFSLLRKPLGKSGAEAAAGRVSHFRYRGLPVTLIRKPYQKSLRLCAEGEGARLSCPVRASKKEIEGFIGAQWGWLQKRIAERKELGKKYPPKKFRAGESFLFCGKALKLKYERLPSENALEGRDGRFCARGNALVYYWRRPEELRKEILKAELRDFYKKEGSQRLREALGVFSSRMGLSPKSIRIGAQKSLWGSCSKEGNVSLNWRLAAAPPSALEYVVIHELAHLKILDHSPAFWDLVSRFCPKYKRREAWLRREACAMDFLLPQSDLHSPRAVAA